MPRAKRQKTLNGLYHIVCRGINKQDIFFDNEDFQRYIKEIIRTKNIYKYNIYAYVLMNNHVHIVIHDRNDNLSKIIQSINVSYSLYFNKKYERTGHLFENRFKSKQILDEKYLKNVIRYIHKNPIEKNLKNYKWSSYNEYIYNDYKVVDKNPIIYLFNNIEEFIKFHNEYKLFQDYDKDFELYTKIDDYEAIKMIKIISKEENILKIQNYEITKRKNIIKQILNIEGIKINQISRLIGINRKTIQKISNEMKNK